MKYWTVYKKEYKSLREVAEHYNIDYYELKEKAKDVKEKDLSGIIRSAHKFDMSYQGQVLTLKQIMKMSGLSKSVIEKRLTRGWSVEKIINTPVRTLKKTERFTVDGKVYNSINALAQIYDIPYCTLLYRIRKRGMSPEEAVHTNKFQRKNRL